MKTCILAYFCVVIVAIEGMWWWLLNNIGLVLHNQVRGTPYFIIVPMTTGYNIACALLPSLVSIPFYAIPISLSIIHRIFYLLVYMQLNIEGQSHHAASMVSVNINSGKTQLQLRGSYMYFPEV